MKKPYTVFGVYEDDKDQRYTATTTANSPEEAEKRAQKEAPAPIIVAAVIEGAVKNVDRMATVTPIRGRGYETSVSRVTVERVRIRLPLRCSKCRADLRKSDALRQSNFEARAWSGRLPRGEHKGASGIVVDDDLGVRGVLAIVATEILCATCKHFLWDGMKE